MSASAGASTGGATGVTSAGAGAGSNGAMIEDVALSQAVSGA